MRNRWSTDDPLQDAPRIAVNPTVVADLETMRAADRPVVLTDGESELVVMVPVEQYRAQLLALARMGVEDSNAQAVSTGQQAVLDPDELDALLAEWDYSQGPRPAPSVTRDESDSVRLAAPPRRRSIGR